MRLTIEEQVKTIEGQLNSQEADFSLLEKLQYIHLYFKNDPMFSQEAMDIVMHNINIELKSQEKSKDIKR